MYRYVMMVVTTISRQQLSVCATIIIVGMVQAQHYSLTGLVNDGRKSWVKTSSGNCFLSVFAGHDAQ